MVNNTEFQKAIDLAATLLQEQSKHPREFTLSIKKRFNGYSLLQVYTESFPHVSAQYWKEKIESGNLTLDHHQVVPNHKVKAGQITHHSVAPKPEPKISLDIKRISANDSYWVIDKPSPLPIHAGGRYQNFTLTKILQTAFPQHTFHLINRLDANTTGIVLVALNKTTAHFLGKQFEERSVQKTYLTVVEGFSFQTEFESNKSIGRSKTSAGGRKIEEGHASLTKFKTLSTTHDHSLLQVTPHSGRTNQIRIHLADLRLPILGDLGYKDPSYFKSNPLTYPSDTLFLHAWKLSFICPETRTRVTVKAAPNKKWEPYMGSLSVTLLQ